MITKSKVGKFVVSTVTGESIDIPSEVEFEMPDCRHQTFTPTEARILARVLSDAANVAEGSY